METTSDVVYEGKLIHENTYDKRSNKWEEIELDGIKVDYYDRKEKIIHEVKKSSKMDVAHDWQLKYYIYKFQENGILGVKGILEYPKLRKTKEVELLPEDIEVIENDLIHIKSILDSDECPKKIKFSFCRKCAYFDFCWVGELDE